MKKVAILLLVALAGLVSCSRARKTFPKAPVILISIDTLRADHLPAYGDRQVRTPAIDSLRRDAVLYRNAISHVPLTLPSHATIFTGLLPPQNGVRDNIAYTLGKSHETLADLLAKRGYATGAAVSSVVLAATTGIGRGFDYYNDDVESPTETASLGQIQRSGFETEKIAEDWISQNDTKPFFFFLHLYEPHSPYEPVEPFKRIYAGRPYDGEIATADEIVGRFLDFLKSRKLYERSILILLSDHGEGLGQHGEDEHGTFIYRETLHVPLLVKLPGERDRGETVGSPVGLVDVFPTLAGLLGFQCPSGLAGRPLPLGGSGSDSPPRNIYSESLYPRYHFGWSDLAGLTNDRYQYIHAPKPELYDFRADPGELENLAPSLPPPFRTLRLALLGMDRPRQAPGVSDPEQVKKLASLGYIGSAAPPETAENLPDAKDHIGELSDLKLAFKAYHDRDYAASVAALQRLLRKNPIMSDAWTQLANAYHKLGLFQEAVRALEQNDRLQPGSPFTLASLATEYYELSDLEKAELFAKRSIAVNGPPQAHEILAAVLLVRKDYDAAEKEARLALGTHRGRRKPYVILAQIAKARGDLQGALAQLDDIQAQTAAKGQAQMSNVSYLRGDILARLGRNAEAEAAFRDEVEHFPNNAAAWSGLAFLYASEGRSDQARQTLADMAKTSPTPQTYRVGARAFRILGDAREAARWEALARRATPSPFSVSAPGGS